VFEADITSTRQAYSNFPFGGADRCSCVDCKNYVANRETIFPIEISQMLQDVLKKSFKASSEGKDRYATESGL
jgi:hypothetical protein